MKSADLRKKSRGSRVSINENKKEDKEGNKSERRKSKGRDMGEKSTLENDKIDELQNEIKKGKTVNKENLTNANGEMK